MHREIAQDNGERILANPALALEAITHLVFSTGADILTADELTGALIAREKGGVGETRGRVLSRVGKTSAPSLDHDTGGAPSQPGSAQPASGGAGAA